MCIRDRLEELFELMRQAEIDMTDFFRCLASLDVDKPTINVVRGAFYRDDLRLRFSPPLSRWLDRYAARLRQDAQPAADRAARMHAANPRYVLRNYLAQEAIDRAEQGDTQRINELLEVLRHPYACLLYTSHRKCWPRWPATPLSLIHI